MTSRLRLVRLFPIVCAVLGAVEATNVTGGDWPQWRGPNRNGHVPPGTPLPTKFGSEPRVLWRVKAGDGLASPVVSGGRVVHLDNQAGKETVHAFQADSGQILWSHPLDDVFKDSQSTPGPRCTPLVDGDRVYAQSCRGELQCLNAQDGKLVWRVNYVTNFGAVFIGEKGQAAGAARHGYNGQPVIDGGHLIALAGGTNGASLVCLDKSSGEVVWKSQNDSAAYAPPIVAAIAGRPQVIAFTVESLMGVDRRDGHLLWRVPLKTTFGRHVTTPVVVENMVIVSSHEFGLIGVRIDSQSGAPQASIQWTNKEAAVNFASPVAVGNHVYGVGPNKNLVCVESKTGSLAWSQDGIFSSAGGKAHAGFVVLGSNILLLTDAGELLLFPAEPRGFRELARAQVSGSNWCNPAYADGRLFLRDSRQLLAVQLAP